MPKETPAPVAEKIERTPAETAAINKAVEAKRSNAPKVAEVKIDEKEPAIIESMSKRELAAIIERYKVQNPVKYAAKKESLETRLKNLK